MTNLFDFINLIIEEASSLLLVVPWYISTAITVALVFAVILGLMRIAGLVWDALPLV